MQHIMENRFLNPQSQRKSFPLAIRINLIDVFLVVFSVFESENFKTFADNTKLLLIRYSQSGRSVPCESEDCLKIDFHDWIEIRILLCYLLLFYLNIASVGRNV